MHHFKTKLYILSGLARGGLPESETSPAKKHGDRHRSWRLRRR
ncbi:hypothetical protein DGI_1129 [Megalodesulfovibrio gigas DSM 1382 = ATCC 19364]|uniref:Uncharacterized protein n=1 Tax=Megalodesulfovibrio gigas (strain ATCC 19364 / DSM 1382 / NCIMB 9332 / VKM B-1759) TaxID=1121448 RepID=T2GA44_MEGG1|nr:hypothetical protein DGI_1129 [Megalodesulfovibrio gigas DSM 1382 = ATCC 19364]